MVVAGDGKVSVGISEAGPVAVHETNNLWGNCSRRQRGAVACADQLERAVGQWLALAWEQCWVWEQHSHPHSVAQDIPTL